MARVNIDILEISELKWTGMGEFNSDCHYIYYCQQESLRQNGVDLIDNKRVWNTVQFSSVQLLSRVRFFVTPWIAACQASLSITKSWSFPKPMSIELVMPSNHFILCQPFSLPQSFPSSGSFQMSELFASGGQSIGVSDSTSVLPMNTRDWYLGWTGWFSFQSKELSRVSSNTTFQMHQFFCTQFSL